MRKNLLKLSVIVLFSGALSCNTGPALEEKTDSDVLINVTTAALNIDVNQTFTLEFNAAANSASVTNSTFFLVPATVASVPTKNTNVMAKASIDMTICNPANAIAGTISSSTSESCATTYTLTPKSPLARGTEYALCVTYGVSFCAPNVNGFFSGLMETFTTVSDNATDAIYTVGGTLIGLNGAVVLQNNVGDDLALTGNGAFTFSTPVTNGAPYNVTVKTNPDGQTCTVSNNSGTINSANVTDVAVNCSNNPPNTYTIGGTLIGLNGAVVLQNNVGDDLALTGNGAFTFSTPVTNGAPYNVTVKTNPSGQTCTISNNIGTINSANVTDVAVTCSNNPPNTYTIGGTISGLSGTVVLQNNATDNLSRGENGGFAFPTALADGTSYSVTVMTNPGTQTCAVANGSGTVSGTNVTNVSITCSTNTYSVGGTLSGLDSGATIVLQNNGGDDLTLATNGNFAFSTKMTDGSGYGVTIKTQPSAQNCTISNANGTISGADVTSVIVVCVDKLIIFVTNTTTSGNIGGVTGADNICAVDSNKPATGTYKAMLVDSKNRTITTDWVLAANRIYIATDETVIGTTSANAVFSFPLDNPIDIATNVWTGLQTDWSTSSNHCSSWKSAGKGTKGSYGSADQTDSDSISLNTAACSTALRLYCVQQP